MGNQTVGRRTRDVDFIEVMPHKGIILATVVVYLGILNLVMIF
jgi:hypothetical protein